MALKILSFVLLANILIAGCASTSQVRQASESEYEIRTYEVFGMDCPGCHDGVEKIVNKVPGVVDSKANWEAAKIEITLEKGADPGDPAIFDAIRKANFTPGKRLR